MEQARPACEPPCQDAGGQTSGTVDINTTDVVPVNKQDDLYCADDAAENEDQCFRVRLSTGPISAKRKCARPESRISQSSRERTHIRKHDDRIKVLDDGLEHNFENALCTTHPALLFENKDLRFHMPDFFTERENSDRSARLSVIAIMAVIMTMFRQ